jgi:hypothetical protein
MSTLEPHAYDPIDAVIVLGTTVHAIQEWSHRSTAQTHLWHLRWGCCTCWQGWLTQHCCCCERRQLQQHIAPVCAAQLPLPLLLCGSQDGSCGPRAAERLDV